KLLVLLCFVFIHSNLYSEQQTQPTAPPPGPQRPLNLPKISEKNLSNGLLVIVAPLPNIPKVTALLSFPVGRATWRAEHPGAPTIAAAVVTEGTATRTSRQIQEELRSMGAGIN